MNMTVLMMNAALSQFSLSLKRKIATEYSKFAMTGSHPTRPRLLNAIPSTTPSRIRPHSAALLLMFFIAARFRRMATAF